MIPNRPTHAGRVRGHRRRRRVIVRAGVAFAVVVGAILPVLSSSGQGRITATAGAAGDGAPRRTVAVAIGDSITQGRGLAPDEAWPILVARERGWTMTNLGTSGAGFRALGASGEAFAAQIDGAIALHPQIVLIGGSDNDIGKSQGLRLLAVTDSDMHRLRYGLPHATIIAISVIAPKASDTQITEIDARVAVTTALVRGIYLGIGDPLGGRAGMLQGDGEHPTAAGQAAIAAAVEAALAAKHIDR